MKNTWKTALKYLDNWMSSFNWDPEHMRHVSRLAVILFDELKSLHVLSEEDRFILEAGALLHDVGFYKAEPAHHKSSCYMILKENFPGITSEQQLMIALVARYHRKSEPEIKHKKFSTLNNKKRKRILKLASLMRLADGLDRSHTCNVRNIKCEITRDCVNFDLETYRNTSAELYGGNKKKCLFEKEFQKKVYFRICRIKD
jgi:exopolyphosphatase / guanosine-5'-triphosphate,3'-diphosphate pyrophosphatase